MVKRGVINLWRCSRPKKTPVWWRCWWKEGPFILSIVSMIFLKGPHYPRADGVMFQIFTIIMYRPLSTFIHMGVIFLKAHSIFQQRIQCFVLFYPYQSDGWWQYLKVNRELFLIHQTRTGLCPCYLLKIHILFFRSVFTLSFFFFGDPHSKTKPFISLCLCVLYVSRSYEHTQHTSKY